MSHPHRRRLWMLLSLLLAGCAAAPPASAPDDAPAGPLAGLAWLTGVWAGAAGETWTEEHWSAPRGGSMIGMNRTVAGDRTVFFEFLRIEAVPGDAITYLASPRGRSPAIAFRLRESGPQRVLFENPGHDFPQRIGYRLEEDGTLVQRIEGEEDGEARASTWRLRRAD